MRRQTGSSDLSIANHGGCVTSEEAKDTVEHLNEHRQQAADGVLAPGAPFRFVRPEDDDDLDEEAYLGGSDLIGS